MNLESVLTSLLQDYRDLQPATPTILDGPPTPLEALRMIHAAHPAIIHGELMSDRYDPLTPSAPKRDWDWDRVGTYEDVLGDGEVSIAITDDGYADSIRQLSDGTSAFVKPLEERIPIRAFLERLCDPNEPETMYLQSQDGNVYRSHPREGGDELAGMRKYVERDVEWMRQAVGESAEAVNLWIGSSRSTTSLHHDPYENVYHVLSGTKTFTLVSPIEGLWLDQHFYPPATLRRNPTPPGQLEPILDPPPAYPVPWVESSTFPDAVQPIVITLHPGDTLYLPSGWWHRVEQAAGRGGLAVAVNYWYNSTLHPSGNALFRMAQRIARLAGRDGVIPVDPYSDSDDGADDVRGGGPGGVWVEGEDSGSGEEWEPSNWGR